MKKSIYLLAALSAALFASCAKDVEKENVETVIESGTTLRAVVEGATDTKVSANPVGVYSWQASDKIAVLDDNGDPFEFTASTAGVATEFTSASSITLGKYAQYPYSDKFAALEDNLDFHIPSAITYSANATNMPMLGKISGDAATFKAVGGLLKLIVYGVPGDATELEFAATNKKISGGFDIADATVEAPVIVTSAKGTGDNLITIDFAGKRSANMVFYIPLPTGTIDGFTLTFNDSELTSKSSSKELVVGRNDIIVAPAINLVVVPDASLTNAEISETLENSYNSEPATISSASGDWTYLNSCLQSSKYQIKNNGYLQTPEFTYNISEIVLNSVTGTSGGFTGTIYFCKSNSTAVANVLTSESCSGVNGKNVTLSIPSGYKTGYIKFSSTGRFSSVTVKFSGASSSPTINISPASPTRTIGIGQNTTSNITGISLSNALDDLGIGVTTSEAWLSATLSEGTLSISSTEYNHETTDRVGYVYLKATGATTRTVTVTQKPSLVASPSLSSDAGDKTFTVSWAPDEKASSYEAYYSTTDNLANPDVAGTPLTVDDSSTPYTVTPSATLTNGTPYYVYVRVASVSSSYSSIYAASTSWAKISVTPTAGGGSLPTPETITFSELSLTNGNQYTSIGKGTAYASTKNFTISFGGTANDGKYYTTGTGIRTYSNNTTNGYFTISSSYNISKVEFTFSADSNAPANTKYSVNTGSMTTGVGATWTGKAKEITITNTAGSGHWRMQSLTVTYTE